jgi:hypothetical protein
MSGHAVGYFIFRFLQEIFGWFRESKQQRLQREKELRRQEQEHLRIKAEAEAEERLLQEQRRELNANMAAWREVTDAHLAAKARGKLQDQATKRY